VGTVRIAMEAKACMTAHIKAIPRLHDELNSSHLTIHGASETTIAVGFTTVNLAEEFVSPDRNKHPLAANQAVVTKHRQPNDTIRVIEKLRQIPRRTRVVDEGYDALGVVVLRFTNDLGAVDVVAGSPAPDPEDNLHYDQMIRRAANLYDERYGNH
jgi:hypothetical protein